MKYCSTILLLLTAVASRAELVLLPEHIVLNHRGATHALLLEEKQGELFTGGRNAGAQFVSSNPAVAAVDANGGVTAVSNGEAVITATKDGVAISASVEVRNADQPFARGFRNHVQPVLFKMGCNTGACHGAAAGKAGFKLSLRGFDHDLDHKVITRQANGRRVSLAEPAESLLLLKPTMDIRHEGGERFGKDSEAYRILREWLEAGAPPAREDDVRVERIDILPKNITLAPGTEQQLTVQAFYSDGTYGDVTRWVKFGTTDESVALVDDNGKVSVTGPGAAAMTAWYSSQVTSARLMVPRATPVADEIYRTAANNNFVDELILRQLKSLQIAPAPLAADEEFVRRAYLDSVGMLPPPEEASAFLADASPDKRARLIENLLARPEYVDYWSYKWSDLLLLSSRNLPRREELTAFYRFIRESVEENKPWDDFVSEILTAKGSTRENGAANYFVMHKETVDLTETTSQAFLGMSVTCARCHNHPLEKWTQDDYFGMANLFARVKLKNGKTGADTDVLPDSFGNIIHPRLGAPVAPRPLEGEPIEIEAPGDRREHLAAWMVSPKNPYFARAIVNRVWKNFMGRGLVDPEDDLRLTNPASNEELLDALALDLVQHDFDLKHLMRTIMNSAAYQRSSKPSDPALPDERYYSNYIIRRLSAEVMLDAYSQATGVHTEFPGYPAGFRALQLPDSQVGSYFLSAFGRPQRIQTCSCERTEDSNVAQTLHIANGDTLNKKLQAENSLVTKLAAMGDREAIDALYLTALSRKPSATELAQASEILNSLPKDGDAAAAERRLAIEDLTWAVLTGKEFTFNH